MNMAIIGASGRAGSALLKEALKRGHNVTAIVRDAGKLKERPAEVLEKGVLDLSREDLGKFDVVIDAFGVFDEDKLYLHSETLKHLVSILKGSKVRLLVVGGAGGLYTDGTHTQRLMDTFGAKEDNMSVPGAMAVAFRELQKVDDVDWTYLSPAQNFSTDIPDTGGYVTGGDELRYNSLGKSEISYGDYAIAMIDEAEQAKHIRQRFTIANAA